jgi:hypothetical protein
MDIKLIAKLLAVKTQAKTSTRKYASKLGSRCKVGRSCHIVLGLASEQWRVDNRA